MMNEHRPAVAPVEQFTDQLHSGIVKWADKMEREVTEDYRQLRYARQWLLANRHEATVDPNHRRNYEYKIERITKKLTRPHE